MKTMETKRRMTEGKETVIVLLAGKKHSSNKVKFYKKAFNNLGFQGRDHLINS